MTTPDSTGHANATRRPQERSARERALRIGSFALALASLGLLTWQFRWVCDDAYISFRYARHLAEGHGLRFNVLDAPVEGYSNFLWVLIAALFERLGVDVPIAMCTLSCCAAVALLALLAKHLAERGPASSWLGAVPLLVYATLPAVALWSTSGLAMMPSALCLFALWRCAQCQRPRMALMAIWTVGAILMRADGFLWVFGCLGVTLWFRRQERPAVRALSGALGIALIAWLALTGFRFGYFGDWLPNTARVKGGFSWLRLERGARYVALFFATFPGLAAALGLGLALARPWRADANASIRSASVLVAAACGYAIWVGGDFMAMGRLLVVALPFIATLLGEGLRTRSGRAWTIGAMALLLFASASSIGVANDRYVVPESLRSTLHFRWNTPRFQDEWKQWWVMNKRCELWVDIGRALDRNAAPRTSLVAGAIGAIGYHSEVHLYDLHGLVNRLGADAAQSQERRSPGTIARFRSSASWSSNRTC